MPPRIKLPATMGASPDWTPPATLDSISAPPTLVTKIRSVLGLASIRIVLRPGGKSNTRTVQMFRFHNPQPGVAPAIPAERIAAIVWACVRDAVAESDDCDGDVEVEVVVQGAYRDEGKKHPTKRRYTHTLHGPTTRREVLGADDDDDPDDDADGDDEDPDDDDDDGDDDDDDDDDDETQVAQRHSDEIWAGPGYHEPGVRPIRHGGRPPLASRHPPALSPQPPFAGGYPPAPQPGFPPDPYQRGFPPQPPPPPSPIGYAQRGQDMFIDHLGGVFAETRATIRELNAHLKQAKENEYRMMNEVIGMSRLTGEQYTHMMRASATGWNALHQGMSMQMSALQNTMAWKEQIGEKESRIRQLETAEQRKPSGPPAWMQLASSLAPLALGAANTITHVVTKQPGPPPPMVTPEILAAMTGSSQQGATPGGWESPPGFQAEVVGGVPGFDGFAEPSSAHDPSAPGSGFAGFGAPASSSPAGPEAGPGGDEAARDAARARFDRAPTSSMASALVSVTPARAVDEIHAVGLGHVWQAIKGVSGADDDALIADRARSTAQLLDDSTADRIAAILPSVDQDGREETSPRRLLHDLRTAMVMRFPQRPPDLWSPPEENAASAGSSPWGSFGGVAVPPGFAPYPFPSDGVFVAGGAGPEQDPAPAPEPAPAKPPKRTVPRTIETQVTNLGPPAPMGVPPGLEPGPFVPSDPPVVRRSRRGARKPRKP